MMRHHGLPICHGPLATPDLLQRRHCVATFDTRVTRRHAYLEAAG
jgi:hypothetical protein